jgi:hypothetical protein
MADPSASPDSRQNAGANLARQSARVARLRAEARENPVLERSLAHVAEWQANRLGATYADLAADARYRDAVAFFRNDLYGAADFGQRDAELDRAAPTMARMLPQSVLVAVAKAIELNALSQELDRLLLARLPKDEGSFTVAEYCAAYRAMGERSARERQIRLIGEVGAALDAYVNKPLVHAALLMMRHPARAAGFAVLQKFLERGFAAFRKMRGAALFLATVDRRERELMEAIFAGANAPFADPTRAAPD